MKCKFHSLVLLKCLGAADEWEVDYRKETDNIDYCKLSSSGDVVPKEADDIQTS
jgi:hypothetical protein